MQSIWSESTGRHKPCPPAAGTIKTDVLIVGGGMAGVLTAHRLTKAGVPCIIAEGATIGSGATKNTTAKITAQHGLVYADIIKHRGIDAARLYLKANTQAIGDYRAMAAEHQCDFEEKTAYVFSADRRDKLEREASAYQILGLPADLCQDPSLPVKTVGMLGMEGQAQFNPLKLLIALAEGLEIYEDTFIQEISEGTAITKTGKIEAKHIVLTTHFPLVNIPGLYFLKLYQHRSYVLALEGAPPVHAMYVDEKPDGLSFRAYQNLLLVGGGDHKTGKRGGGYPELRKFVKRVYPQAVERFHWAAQDCMTLDSIPYIGRHRAGKHKIYTATGFNKWGMTGAMVASKGLCELITEGKSELEKLYSPQRSMLTPQLAVNIGSAAAGLLSIGGPRCPHMGCKLHKNGMENTWDCSCHGSRFDQTGKLIDNPAKRDARI